MIRNLGTIEQFTLLLHPMQRDSAILIANEVLHHDISTTSDIDLTEYPVVDEIWPDSQCILRF